MSPNPNHVAHLSSLSGSGPWPIVVCVLGPFRVLKGGRTVKIRSGGKTESLLCTLALRHDHAVPRDVLLHTLWPDGDDRTLAGQALDSLVHSVHKLLRDAIGGKAPVMHVDGCYRLNREAGVTVDVAHFDALVREGDRHAGAGDHAAAAVSYGRAIDLYRDDLHGTADAHAVVERERLRALFLTLIARLADYHYRACDYGACLDYARRLLSNDPCREDAHRLIIRCHVRQGERAQAMRQYRLCEDILRAEFDAMPEPATTALFDQVRRAPHAI